MHKEDILMPYKKTPKNYSAEYTKGKKVVQQVDTAAGIKKLLAEIEAKMKDERLIAEDLEKLAYRKVALEKKLIELERPAPKVVPSQTGSIIAERQNDRVTRFTDNKVRF